MKLPFTARKRIATGQPRSRLLYAKSKQLPDFANIHAQNGLARLIANARTRLRFTCLGLGANGFEVLGRMRAMMLAIFWPKDSEGVSFIGGSCADSTSAAVHW